jgi:hypothetical protein
VSLVLGPVLAAANKLVLSAPANRAALYLLLFFHAIMGRQPVFEVITERTSCRRTPASQILHLQALLSLPRLR